MTWRIYSIPIWYSIPGLQEHLERILSALDAVGNRGIEPVPVDRARDVCHQADRELSLLGDRLDGMWTGGWQADIGDLNQNRALSSLSEACTHLQDTLDRLGATVDAIPSAF